MQQNLDKVKEELENSKEIQKHLTQTSESHQKRLETLDNLVSNTSSNLKLSVMKRQRTQIDIVNYDQLQELQKIVMPSEENGESLNQKSWDRNDDIADIEIHASEINESESSRQRDSNILEQTDDEENTSIQKNIKESYIES